MTFKALPQNSPGCVVVIALRNMQDYLNMYKCMLCVYLSIHKETNVSKNTHKKNGTKEEERGGEGRE